MSIQLADLQTDYTLFAVNPQNRKNFTVAISRTIKYNFWWVHSGVGKTTLFEMPEEECPLMLDSNERQAFFEGNEYDAYKYPTAQAALDAVKLWADTYGYKLSLQLR